MTLDCRAAIGHGPVPAHFQVILGVVALPTSPMHPALGASRTYDPGVPRLFAKTGLLVKAGASFTLKTSADPDAHAAIGWGNYRRPQQGIVVSGCTDRAGSSWLAYPGGYYADKTVCMPLTVATHGRSQEVHIGIGTAYDGQSPPPTR